MRRERRRSHPPMGTALCMAETVAREWNQSIANPTFCCVGGDRENSSRHRVRETWRFRAFMETGAERSSGSSCVDPGEAEVQALADRQASTPLILGRTPADIPPCGRSMMAATSTGRPA